MRVVLLGRQAVEPGGRLLARRLRRQLARDRRLAGQVGVRADQRRGARRAARASTTRTIAACRRVDAAERPRAPRPPPAIHGDCLEHAAEARHERVAVQAVGCVDLDDRLQAIDCRGSAAPASPSSRAARSRPWTPTRREIADGHIVCEDGRIAAVGEGAAPAVPRTARAGSTAAASSPRPGWSTATTTSTSTPRAATRSRRRCSSGSSRSTRSGQHIDDAVVDAAARAGLAALARSGCTTSTDHHYIFPRHAGDLLGGRDRGGARDRRCASTPAAARWTSGAARAGCRRTRSSRSATRSSPPAPTRSTASTIPAPGAMVRIALAPTSPFSVSRRADGARPRSWPARAACGCTRTSPRPTTRRRSASSASACARSSTSTSLGWLGDDVWLAHCVHLDGDETRRMGATGTGVAHCPTSNGRLGAGIAPVAVAARGRRAGRARRRRRRVERVRRAGRRAARRARARARVRRARPR